MKKIISLMAILVLSTVSAKAISMPSLGLLELKAGIANNSSVWGASGEEHEFGEAGADEEITKASGVFAESFDSQFVELGIGQYLSIGIDVVNDEILTPTNVSNEGGANEATVSVGFNDLTTTYVKLNIPFMNGVYLKAGDVEVDLDIKETVGSGRTYRNVSTNGTSVGGGYERQIGDTPLGIRLEGNYIELDAVTTNNGVATTANFNRIDVKNMEGLTGKVALTFTLGRN